MAFNKNWKQFIVSKGEPFQIEYLTRAFGGRSRVVFKVNDTDGSVTVNGREMNGSQNITGSLTTSTGVNVGGNLAVTGTSAFTDAVTLPANTVTGANLATALAAQIPMTATLSVGALVGDGRTVTIQVKDAGGVNMALVGRYDVWVSATAKGTPIGTSTTGLTTTIPSGTLALTKLANLDFEILSTAAGALSVLVTDTNGTETRFVNIAVNGVVYASGAVVTT
jgi:hypothetical protein